ncbi:MAG: hypothetical protein CXR30_18945 [Geobacter sp.]|nr:MAG: hypothetical protein CXR30_18945 [Geobacter sp.]
MSNYQLRIPDYLEHIIAAIQRIHRYTLGMTELDFLENEQVQDAVLRNIEIIGEAARNIERSSPEFVALHSEVPWEEVYLMRNRICYGYFSVDLEVVWHTVQRYIPELEKQIQDLIQTIAN